ncbi:Sec-independent protein translocase protein TatB [Marinobacterium litorale]|uniref:Sec-independent protein translocase protein TatB n=1 Tax=Marinobacterium litorale TaxID=404770 RepID=UPI000408A6FA|nr:Sec-independent protein translocase protein TatB [Marinobacterium litorale]
MVDIGFSELLIIAVVALLVLGPDRLPIAAKTCGLWLGRIRRTVGSIQSEIREELKVEELKQAAARKRETLEQELGPVKRSFGSNRSDDVSADTTRSGAPDSKEMT